MTTFKDLAKKRFSLRSFSSEPVDDERLDYILECARIAPSAVNFQPWHFYIARSEEALQKVRQTYPRDWFATAPLVIVGCIRHDQSWHRPTDQKDHGDIDIAIATEHICLAATEQGLGTCWVCNFDARLCHELLQLPESEEAAVLIPLGFPAADAKPRGTTRKAFEEIVTEL
ncbi:MAG: nitroreductase family protein [Bacteroidaceae bacterium]|nr:nitroreductase family protein [Bacteroidaceae bacterium]